MNANFNQVANYQQLLSELDSLDLKILTYFYDENGLQISQRTALYYFKMDYTKSDRTFYNRVEKLEKFDLILHTYGKSPKYFVVTNLALSLGLINSNDSNLSSDLVLENFKPVENILQMTSTIANTLKIPANSMKKSEISIFKYFNDIFLAIIHNFQIKIPIEINSVNYHRLEQLDSTFKLVAENVNVRRYSKKLNMAHPQGNYKAFVDIRQTFALIRLYEIHTLELNTGFSKAIDRVLEVIDAVQKSIGLDKIQFAEISQWKFPEGTGKVVSLDCELANHPINHLLKMRVKFARKTFEWKLIDHRGNKIGFDCSPRNLGKGRRREPHLEMTGKDAYENTEFLLQDMRYQMQKKIGVEKLHEIIRGVRSFTQKNRQKINELEENQREIIKTQTEIAQLQSQQGFILEALDESQKQTLELVKENSSLITKLMTKLFPKDNILQRFYQKIKGIFT